MWRTDQRLDFPLWKYEVITLFQQWKSVYFECRSVVVRRSRIGFHVSGRLKILHKTKSTAEYKHKQDHAHDLRTVISPLPPCGCCFVFFKWYQRAAVKGLSLWRLCYFSVKTIFQSSAAGYIPQKQNMIRLKMRPDVVADYLSMQEIRRHETLNHKHPLLRSCSYCFVCLTNSNS